MTRALTLARPAPGVAVLELDDVDATVNALKRELASELDEVLAELESDTSLEALVFASGKPDSFIVGADLEMLRHVHDAAEAEALSRLFQRMQDRVATLPMVTIAAIHGSCLGGGLELALAFDARIASDHGDTRLGLPEVQLGLLPGGGGTQRLPRLLGLPAALDLLLTGRRLGAARARALGLVDELAPRQRLREASLRLATRLAAARRAGTRLPLRRPVERRLSKAGFLHWLLAGNAVGRKLVLERARASALAKTRGHYPAPPRILDVVATGLARGMAAGLDAEARAFGELVASPVAAELINLFFVSNALKKDTGVDDDSVEPRPLAKVGVLGAGLMGTGIAYVSALHAGLQVAMQDKDPAALERARLRIGAALGERVRRGRMQPQDCDRILARIETGVAEDTLSGVDVVIEAVFEDLALKRQMVDGIERHCRADTIFASNTSALPIARIGEASRRPGNVLGMHYFSPVEKMPLLEVVAAERSSDEAIATCVALGKRQRKTVIVVRDTPGFYTSRILAPYLNEAVRLVSEGVAVEVVDEALLDFGFPTGPLSLLDEVGFDVAGKVAQVLFEAFGERFRPPSAVQALQADGRLGRKNKRGFYRYDSRSRRGRRPVDSSVYRALGVETRTSLPADAIAERCVLGLINEAVLCLEQGVLRSARDGDVGAVFGLGFPPFRGGPFRYLDAVGARALASRLSALEARYGERFRPAALLAETAARGAGFHAADAPAATRQPRAGAPGLGEAETAS